MGFSCGLLGHKWNYCTCVRCGKHKPDALGDPDPHDWNGCMCRVCRKTRDQGHTYKNRVCQVCGKQTSKQDVMKHFGLKFESGLPWACSGNAAELLDIAYANFPEEDADDILVRAYEAYCDSYKVFRKPAFDLETTIVPHVHESVFMRLYDSSSGNIWQVAQHLDPGAVIQWSNNAGWDADKQKAFLIDCMVACEGLVTPCDFRKHEYEFLGSRMGNPFEDEPYPTYYQYRCKRCGYETESPKKFRYTDGSFTAP